MSTEDPTAQVVEQVAPVAADEPADPDVTPAPSWWHREHPVFTPLAGFFTGLVSVLVVPALFAALVGAIAGSDRVGELFPFVLLTLAVPLGLVSFVRTRRFGAYMLLGMVTTAVVVLGVGGLVLWYLVSHQ